MTWRRSVLPIALSFALRLAGFVAPPPAGAEHHNRGNHVFAAAPCAPGSANTATSTGVPACSPAVRASDCVAEPTDALSGGRSRFVSVPLGRTKTPSHGTTDVRTRFQAADVLRCGSGRFDGTLGAPIIVRVTAEDPACAGEHCTLPDLSITDPMDCRNGACRMVFNATGGVTPAPLPVGLPWSGTFVQWNVLDPVGAPFMRLGLIVGVPQGNEPIRMPAEGPMWEGRFVQAFAPCLPGSEDTVTGEGIPACSQPRPLSDCTTDPGHAVGVAPDTGLNYGGSPGKGKVGLKVNAARTEAYFRRLHFSGLLDCAGNPYQGTLDLVARVRATLADSACSGGFCTAVDTDVRLPIAITDGQIKGKNFAFPLAAAFRTGSSTAPLNAEILRFDLRDTADNPIMIGPGYLIRCDRANPGACFGN